MFKEASMFAAHLRQVEKDLTAWERDIECESIALWALRAALRSVQRL
jgi:hypothetical protein